MTTYGSRTCMKCGTQFDAVYPAQVCCSKKCQNVRTITLANERKKRAMQRCREMQDENTKLQAEIEELKARIKELEAGHGIDLKMEVAVCERMKLRTMSGLPYGQRVECFSPRKCSKVPKGCTLDSVKKKASREYSLDAYTPSHRLA